MQKEERALGVRYREGVPYNLAEAWHPNRNSISQEGLYVYQILLSKMQNEPFKV